MDQRRTRSHNPNPNPNTNTMGRRSLRDIETGEGCSVHGTVLVTSVLALHVQEALHSDIYVVRTSVKPLALQEV